MVWVAGRLRGLCEGHSPEHYRAIIPASITHPGWFAIRTDPKIQWNVGYWIPALLILLWMKSVWQASRALEPIPYSQFEKALANGEVTEVAFGERITIGPTSIKFALSLEGFGKAVLSLLPGGQSAPVGSGHQNALLHEPPLAKYGQKITKIRKTRAPDLDRKSQEVVSKIGFETPFSGEFPEARSGA